MGYLKNSRNFNPDYKLWTACGDDDFRPVYNYIMFKDGYAYATDGYILVRVPLSDYCNIPEEETALLNGYAIRKDMLRYVLTLGNIWIDKETVTDKEGKEKEEVFITGSKGYNVVRVYLVKEADAIKFPKCDVLFKEESSREPLSLIGINLKFLARLSSAMGVSRVKLEFTKQTSKAFVLPFYDEERTAASGIIMPILLDD